MRASSAVILFVFISSRVCALEPVSALDDGFAVPSGDTMVEAAFSYPGSESFIMGSYAAGAWMVPYGIDELTVTTGFAGARAGKAGIYLSYTGSGFDLYGEEQEKLGVSFTFFRGAAAGIRITRNAMRIRGFGHATAWSSDAGLVLHPRGAIYIAGSIEDLAGAELGESCEPLDGHMRLAASWRIPGEVTFLATATKVRRFDLSLAAGCMSNIGKILTVGIIGANEPDRFEFLCGVKAGRINISYRGSYHRNLGMTHGFTLYWTAGNDNVSRIVHMNGFKLPYTSQHFDK